MTSPRQTVSPWVKAVVALRNQGAEDIIEGTERPIRVRSRLDAPFKVAVLFDRDIHWGWTPEVTGLVEILLRSPDGEDWMIIPVKSPVVQGDTVNLAKT